VRTRYKLAISALVLLFIAFEFAVVGLEFASAPWLESALQGAAVFVALIASVIALHSSDREPPKVTSEVSVAQGRHDRMTHTREDKIERVWRDLGHSLTQINSARVHFRIVNTSPFTLHSPTISFRLPSTRRHPHRIDGQWVLTFNSNLYNSPESLKTLQFGDTTIISNSNLPFWNPNTELIIWIRMVMDAPDLSPFQVEVALNAENAQGFKMDLTINPNEYLSA